MHPEFETTPGEAQAASHTSRRIVFLAAVISTVCGILYFAGLTGKLIVDGTIHSASAQPIPMVSGAIGLVWDIALLIMFVALRRLTARRQAVFAELALVFMALLCATSSLNWYVQLTLVPRLAQPGEATLLALVDIHQNSSITYAMEHLAWSVFYGLATLFMGVAMEGGKLETWIRWLFFVGGALSLLYVPGIMLTNSVLIDLGYFAAGVLLPITTLLLAIQCGPTLRSPR